MTCHFIRRHPWVVLISGLALISPAVGAATVGMQLAPGLTAQQEAAILRQVERTLSGSSAAAETDSDAISASGVFAESDQSPTSTGQPARQSPADSSGVAPAGWQLEDDGWRDHIERRMAPRPAVSAEDRRDDPNHWRRYPQTGVRSPLYRPLNREGEGELAGWMQQLYLEGVIASQRPLLVMIRNGRVEAGWEWRADVPLSRSASLFLHSSHGRLTSEAVLNEFFRHANRLDNDTLRGMPAQWQGVDRDGWHLLRHGFDDIPRVPQRSPLSAPDPWDFRR